MSTLMHIILIFLLCRLCTSSDLFPSNSASEEEQQAWSSDRFQNAQPMTVVADFGGPDELPVEAVVTNDTIVNKSRCHRPAKTFGDVNLTTTLYVSNYSIPDPDEEFGRIFFQVKRAIHPEDGPYTSSRVDVGIPTWPYSLIGKLYFTRIADSMTATCSAAVIQQNLIVTASHCAHDGKTGFNSNFRFAPGYVNGSAPYGMWLYEKVWASPSWTKQNGKIPNEADWALIQMKPLPNPKTGDMTKIGELLGWFGYKTNSLKGNHVTSLGYPSNLDQGEQMHEVNSQYKRFRAPNMAEYPNDMEEGASGGPWIADFGVKSASDLGGESNQLVGIASYRDKDLSRRYLGSSIFNEKFVAMMEEACGIEGNCVK